MWKEKDEISYVKLGVIGVIDKWKYKVNMEMEKIVDEIEDGKKVLIKK